MDLKKEPLDLLEGVLKIEPEDDLICKKPVKIDNQHGGIVLGDVFESQSTEHYVNVDEFKLEIVECEVPKVEPSSEFPTKMDHESVPLNVHIFPTTIKKEPEESSEVKVLDIGNIKQEVCEYDQLKSELLTTDCDLPTLKNESEDYPDYYDLPCSSKQAESRSNLSKNTTRIVSKKKKRRLYPCPVCQKNFPSSKSRSKHIDGHFEKRSAVCKFCGKSMTKIDFLRHYFIHVVKTTNFSQEYYKVSRLQQHLIIDEKPFKCHICLKECNYKYLLLRHLKIHAEKKPSKCDICFKEFNRKSNLQRHLKNIHANEKPFKCEVCFKQIARKYDLQQHLKIHTNEKAFKCDICYRKFNLKSSFKIHIKNHSNEKPFKCHICFKKFNANYFLKRHLLIHTNGKPYKCDVCLKEFNRNSNLKQHLLIHSNEKPFNCDICFKQFSRKYDLQNHLISHRNENPYECDICLQKLNHKSSLRQHILTHSDEKPFKCDFCSKGFVQKGNFQRHLTIHYKVKDI